MRVLPLTRLLILAVLITTTLFSCKGEKEEFTTEALADYMPLTIGKYITYRLDSMVFTSFGRTTEIHKYQVKHVVDSKFTDIEGRPSYRINTFFRDSVNTSSWTAEQPWITGKAYYISPLEDQIEVMDQNLFRIIKLHLPFKEGFEWKGNRYLAGQPYTSFYNFSNDDNMGNWDFIYDSYLPLFSYRGINYSNVWSVEEEDEETNLPIIATVYAAKTRSVEKYSKGIGLIYREHELWEYQPNTGGSGGPYKIGFGVTMWMIDHN